jgi:hypothetical protein
LALAWLLTRPAVTAPIIDPRTRDQLDSALPAVKLSLSPEHLGRLNETFPGRKTATEDYAWLPPAHLQLLVVNGNARAPSRRHREMRSSNISLVSPRAVVHLRGWPVPSFKTSSRYADEVMPKGRELGGYRRPFAARGAPRVRASLEDDRRMCDRR